MTLDVAKPHHPSPECEPQHCWWHNADEDPDGAYRVCFECRHVYKTAKDLRQAWADERADCLRPDIDVVVPPVEQIFACPFCAHDW